MPKKKKVADKHKRWHAYFTGRVQGVGFRYTAEKFALDLRLVGWVKNLPDGRVELICEGQEKVIEDFLSLIKESHLGTYLKKVDAKWFEATGEFDDFRVEFYL